ncbi:MAG TPA: hypothetical protein VFG91_01710 [Woeseiaceae bacterium]|nr:hypothetical protein [Woeseiaceae bacterium]
MSSLFKKLNLGSHSTVHVLNAPQSFESELAQLARLADVRVCRALSPKDRTAFAIAFAITRAELDAQSRKLIHAAEGDAIIWMAYPKGTSRKYKCEFNRDTGWFVLQAAGYEPVRQVAIDEDWSALRFRSSDFVRGRRPAGRKG